LPAGEEADRADEDVEVEENKRKMKASAVKPKAASSLTALPRLWPPLHFVRGCQMLYKMPGR
jgi:hypothetical protein